MYERQLTTESKLLKTNIVPPILAICCISSLESIIPVTCTTWSQTLSDCFNHSARKQKQKQMRNHLINWLLFLHNDTTEPLLAHSLCYINCKLTSRQELILRYVQCVYVIVQNIFLKMNSCLSWSQLLSCGNVA